MQPIFDYAKESAVNLLWPVYWTNVTTNGYQFAAVYARETENTSVFKIRDNKYFHTLGLLTTKSKGQIIAEYVACDASVFVMENANSISINIAGKTQANVEEVRAELNKLYPLMPLSSETQIKQNFWYQIQEGATYYSKKIDVPVWADIADHYPPEVRKQLDDVMTGFVPNIGGKLIVWTGERGTGKTTALRAFCKAISPWCDFEYITDPEKFFNDPSYMMNVFLSEDSFGDAAIRYQEDPTVTVEYVEGDEGNIDYGANDRWKLVIFEDAGELLSADASTRTGQALSRFLNVTEGMLGQGMKVIIMVTTNEELGKLHPAVSRPGRCANKIRFDVLSRSQAQELVKQAGKDESVLTNTTYTLAEVFAIINDFSNKGSEGSKAIGFAAR